MTHSQEIVDSLRKQYTLNNDGAGLDGRCRVSNKDLLELLRLVEQTEQQNAELKEQSSRLANESVRQAQQNADLCVKNAELLAALIRTERKLSAYVGVCTGDKELLLTVLPMAREAIAKAGGA